MNDPLQTRRLDSTVYYVTVCNYSQDQPGITEEANTTYDFEAWLEIRDDSGSFTRITADNWNNYSSLAGRIAQYSIAKYFDDETRTVANPVEIHFSQANPTVTFSNEELKGGRASVDRFQVKIDSESVSSTKSEIFVHVEAKKKTGSGMSLYARLYGQQNETENTVWTGSITDSNYKTADYDFYNYVVTGNGEGTLDVIWDPDMIEINKFFLNIYDDIIVQGANNEKIQVITESGKTWNKITMNVDSKVENRYEIQLYKRGESFDKQNLDSYIRCGFTKKTAPGGQGDDPNG
jgi:hypothetical protein